jgi:hypothetical protein
MSSPFTEVAATLNTSILEVFGEAVTLRKGGADEYSLQAVLTAPPSSQLNWAPDFVKLEFRRSDISASVERGDIVLTSSNEYRVVDVDQTIDDWTRVKLQRVK